MTYGDPSTAFDDALAQLASSPECVTTLMKVIDNILKEKEYTSKTRKLKLTSKSFQERIGNAEGGLDFLYACRFTKQGNTVHLTKENESKHWLWHARQSLQTLAELMDIDNYPPCPSKPTIDSPIQPAVTDERHTNGDRVTTDCPRIEGKHERSDQWSNPVNEESPQDRRNSTATESHLSIGEHLAVPPPNSQEPSETVRIPSSISMSIEVSQSESPVSEVEEPNSLRNANVEKPESSCVQDRSTPSTDHRQREMEYESDSKVTQSTVQDDQSEVSDVTGSEPPTPKPSRRAMNEKSMESAPGTSSSTILTHLPLSPAKTQAQSRRILLSYHSEVSDLSELNAQTDATDADTRSNTSSHAVSSLSGERGDISERTSISSGVEEAGLPKDTSFPTFRTVTTAGDVVQCDASELDEVEEEREVRFVEQDSSSPENHAAAGKHDDTTVTQGNLSNEQETPADPETFWNERAMLDKVIISSVPDKPKLIMECWGSLCLCMSRATLNQSYMNSFVSSSTENGDFFLGQRNKNRPWIPLDAAIHLWSVIFPRFAKDDPDAFCSIHQAMVEEGFLEEQSSNDGYPYLKWVRVRNDKCLRFGESVVSNSEKVVKWLAALAESNEPPETWYAYMALPSMMVQSKHWSDARALLTSEEFMKDRLNACGLLTGTCRQIHDCQFYAEQAVETRYSCDESASVEAHDALLEHSKNQLIQVALTTYEKLTAILFQQRKTIERNRRNKILSAFHMIGKAAGELGEHNFELELYEKCLKLQRAAKDAERDNGAIADITYWKGMCHKSRGDSEIAMKYYEESLALYRTTFGDFHKKAATVLQNMGVVHFERDEFDLAMGRLKCALHIWQDTQQIDTPNEETTDVLCWIGKVYREQDLPDKALKYFNAARRAQRELYGGKSRQVAENLRNVAALLELKGEFEQSLWKYKECFQIRKHLYGDEHEELCEVFSGIGNVYRSRERYDLALSFMKRSLRMRLDLVNDTKLDNVKISHMILSYDDVIDTLQRQNKKKRHQAGLEEELAVLYLKLAQLHERTDQFHLCIENFEKSLEVHRLAGDKGKSAHILNLMGIAYAKRKKFDRAMPYLLECFEIRKALYGIYHMDVGETLHNLGNCAAKAGNYKGAQKYYEEALFIKRKHFKWKHPSLAQTLHNLGSVEFEQENYDTAMKLFMDALSIRKYALGGSHLDVAFSLHNIGKAHKKKGDLSAAISNFAKSLQIKQANLGNEHPLVSETLQMMGLAYVERGDNECAIKSLNAALHIQKMHSCETESCAEAHQYLGAAYEGVGNYAKARSITERALSIRKAVHGENHLLVSDTLYLLGKLCKKMKEPSGALESFEQAIRIRKANRGQNDVKIAEILNDAGEIQLSLSQIELAEAYFLEALKIQRLELDDQDKRIGKTLTNIAEISVRRGKFTDAIASFSDAVAIFTQSLGKNHLSIATLYQRIGSAHQGLKEYDRAIASYEKCLSLRKVQLGADSELVADVNHDLGRLHLETGSWTEAEDFLRDSLEVKVKIKGDQDLSVADTILLLGQVSAKMKSPDEALMYFEKAKLVKAQHLGREHLECAEIAREMGAIFEAKGEHEQSLLNYKFFLDVRRTQCGDDEIVIEALQNVGEVQLAMKAYDAARRTFESSIELCNTIMGEENLMLARAMHNLGLIYDAKQMRKEAMKCHMDSWHLFKDLLGDDHLKVASSLDSIAGLHQKRGDNEEALECLKESLRIRRHHFGNDHIEVGTTLFGMGILFSTLADPEKAMGCYAFSLKIRRQALGEDSIEVAQTLHNMGSVFAMQCEYAKALEKWREALATYRNAGLSDEKHMVACTIGNINMAESLIEMEKRESDTISSEEIAIQLSN